MAGMMSASEVIAFHEEREHGCIDARWWGLLKEMVEKNGKFPPRTIFRAIARNMYETPGKWNRKVAKRFCPSGWEHLTNPKING